MPASYRVIENLETHCFYVQRKCGIIFRSWEYVDQYGGTYSYNEDLDYDCDPAIFDSEGAAYNFMVWLAEGIRNKPRSTIKVVAWIGDRE